jgi:hypothetical protein
MNNGNIKRKKGPWKIERQRRTEEDKSFSAYFPFQVNG